ncbi:AraC family transcriptional regulator [Sinomicrobium weinanense]|uniref:AraC family transcriptional regulator n=1 Tax=Sinomicrobium weinanense TaxID=2842200 RepID=A0A926Q501_9FLAO|nr:helix-turn-helix domain-containing protein [Sinomicrobium weinanense]MBC9798549.1 AraC family transcriptional regulator [Sinomicrobium weinanense]MBU3122534.1 helix-turn-helix domain-containing protein [Sinomicrobium weinanense]
MIYHQVKPHPDLADFIDAFWTAEGAGKPCDKEIILPDGCVDLIFNLREDCKTDHGTLTMHSQKTYLVGTMTTFKETFLNASNKLVGIRFKPAAFSSFYQYAPLHEITDKTIEFESSISPDIHKIEQSFVSYLNTFFLNRLGKPKHNLAAVVKDIQTANGQIGIGTLAKRNYTTIRQLERNFKKHIGISPKEFANIVRFKAALSRIKHNKQQQSLLDIAFDCGYYDHAHLTNEIKRYSGIAPSHF